MDFSLSKKEILFQQMIRAFAEKEVKPLAAEVDEEERFPVETVEKMAHSNEIQFCLILPKQPQLLHFFLHKNNSIPDVKGRSRETAEESYIFSVIIEALIHVSDGTGFHSQKIGHWKIFKPDSFRETKSVKQISVNELDPWVWRNRR